tara:strand:- start:104 stop:709 length:606 start_codon:yes stop_codon:yes gene_type:complete
MTIPISLLKDAALKAGLEKLLDNANIAEEDIRKFMPMSDAIAGINQAKPPELPRSMAVDGAVYPRPPMNNSMADNINFPSDPEKVARIQNAKQSLATMRLAQGGQTMQQFSGQVPGDGHGMEDNVYMPIVDNGNQVATLAVSPDEYVVDAHTMSALGNGSADEGADVMDQIIKEVRQEAFGTTQQPNQINGLQSLRNKLIG